MSFTVGPGVKTAMTQANDEPRSDEVYVVNDPVHAISLTYGRDALYYYYKEDNRVNRLPFDV
jgi:hypothetical protein